MQAHQMSLYSLSVCFSVGHNREDASWLKVNSTVWVQNPSGIMKADSGET